MQRRPPPPTQDISVGVLGPRCRPGPGPTRGLPWAITILGSLCHGGVITRGLGWLLRNFCSPVIGGLGRARRRWRQAGLGAITGSFPGGGDGRRRPGDVSSRRGLKSWRWACASASASAGLLGDKQYLEPGNPVSCPLGRG